MIGFPSILVVVGGSIYSLVFCVVAYLEGKDGVRNFLVGSEAFIQRLAFEHTVKALQIMDEFLPRMLLSVERFGRMVASSILFLSDRFGAVAQFIISESATIAMIILFVFFMFSMVYNYTEVRGFLLAILDIVGGFLAAVFSIINDPSKLASVVLLMIFPQFLYILRAVLMKQ